MSLRDTPNQPILQIVRRISVGTGEPAPSTVTAIADGHDRSIALYHSEDVASYNVEIMIQRFHFGIHGLIMASLIAYR